MERRVRGKYRPLYEALRASTGDHRRLTFAQLEEIIGVSLPRSAFQYREWWANEQERSGGRHPQARAWMLAGWQVETVALANKEVVFRRVSQSKEQANASTERSQRGSPGGGDGRGEPLPMRAKAFRAMLVCTLLGYTATAFILGAGVGLGLIWLVGLLGHVPKEHAVTIFLASVAVVTGLGFLVAWDIVSAEWRRVLPP